MDGSLAAIRTIVRNGVPKPKKFPAPMPPMGGARLSRQEIDAVAAYVFGFSRDAAERHGPPTTGAASAVAVSVRRRERT